VGIADVGFADVVFLDLVIGGLGDWEKPDRKTTKGFVLARSFFTFRDEVAFFRTADLGLLFL
jgi:hypothetical protein